MNTPNQSFASALHDAHTDLLIDLQELEKATTSTSSTSPAELGSRFGKLRTHVTDHFRFEEKGGYMAPVLKEEPRFGAEVKELLAEHREMTQALDAIIADVGSGAAGPDASRPKIQAWVGKVRQHETRENDLVQKAYYSGARGD